MSNEQSYVLAVLDGPVPDGRVYTELTEADLAIIIEAVDDWLDGIARTRRDLEGKELDFHDEYMEEVAGTLEKIREFNK